MQIKFDWQPKQDDVVALMNSRATTVGIGGSRGGSKSGTGRRVILNRRLELPGTSGMIFRRTWDLVRENHLENGYFREWPFLEKFYNSQNKEIKLPNGSVIAFRYGETATDIRSMIGKEYFDIFVDQAEMLTESELQTLQSLARWPGAGRYDCKSIWSFNPGNVGAAYLKRVMVDRQFRERENPEEFAFVQMYGWDNVEWVRAALEAEGFTDDDFYTWSPDRRFEYFTAKSQYGRWLDGLPAALRLGWLLGNFDKFAGQYFSNFDAEPGGRHVRPVWPESWHSRVIGIDWGFAHNSAVYWNAQIEARLTSVYREFTGAGRSPRALAQEIVDRTPVEEREKIKRVFLSHDAFAKRDEREPIAIQIAQVFKSNGLPEPVSAGKDRMGRAALIYDLLEHNEVVIHPSCVGLIEVLPMITRDEDDRENTVKFEGDDAFDAFAHSLTGRSRPKDVPQEVVVRKQAESIADPTAKWFFLTKNLQRTKQKKVRFQAPVVMPWQKGV